MTRKVTKWLLVAVLVWGMVPGVALAAENLWAVATTGHAAHSGHRAAAPDAIDSTDSMGSIAARGARDGGRSPIDSEHGCSGAVHFCFCHHSLLSMPTPVAIGAACGALPERASSFADRIPSDPVLSGLERPPKS